MEKKPAFLITIDTEGDNLWGLQKAVVTRNASFLPRFQALCEKYGLKPTYLTDYEMAKSDAFAELGRRVIESNTGEIGMHLHAWNMPPEFQVTGDDETYHPYLTDYPDDIMREKIGIMTDLLEEAFGTKMLSHRGGRWAFNEKYAHMLVERGYKVDCSVTPHVSWKDTLGDPKGDGGPDYTHFPDRAYFLDPEDISRPGNSPLLEVPMSINKCGFEPANKLRRRFGNFRPARKALYILFPPVTWLRPAGGNLRQMVGLIKKAVKDKRDYVEFMLHSSEFMPGGSPTFKTPEDIENLYRDMEGLFETASRSFEGLTLAEYYERFAADRAGRRE